MIRLHEYGASAEITQCRDGMARLVIRVFGKKVHDKKYKSVMGAKRAWHRFCY